MRSILIVSATPPEQAWLQSMVENTPLDGIEVHFLTTGVGMLNAALSLGHYLATNQPDMAVQVGIAGSFSLDYPVGSVVEVAEEILPELGASSPQGFLSMQELGFPLLKTDQGEFFNKLPNQNRFLSHLSWVSGSTVNTVSGTESGIKTITQRWNPEIETMEGAAFFLAMIKQNVPFMEVRGISNRVEPRDRSSWKIKEAMLASQQEVWAWMKNIHPKMEE